MKKSFFTLDNRFVSILFLVIFFTTSLYSFDRRRDQYKFKPGYVILPTAYSIPGIGDGVAYVGMANNIFDTQSDIILDYLTGDVKGYGLGLTDLYISKNDLKVDIFYEKVDYATIQNYSSRGMGSDKDDYTNITVEDYILAYLKATKSFFKGA